MMLPEQCLSSVVCRIVNILTVTFCCDFQLPKYSSESESTVDMGTPKGPGVPFGMGTPHPKAPVLPVSIDTPQVWPLTQFHFV